MAKELERLSEMKYPGRVIIVGTAPDGSDVVMYSITGRSPSSQARKLEIDAGGNKILVKPTDEEVLKTGDPDLLIYPSIIIDRGIAVSNGKQTADIPPEFTADQGPAGLLERALAKWQYEPDDPNFTPRISGCVKNGAALSILKRSESGQVVRNYFDLPREKGTGWLIATYTGENVNPLPSFKGEPLKVGLNFKTADEAAASMYDALAPSDGNDFRVASAAVFQDAGGKVTVALKNRHGK